MDTILDRTIQDHCEESSQQRRSQYVPLARSFIFSAYPCSTVILVQAENEFSAGTDKSPYMQAIIDLYRANGIDIRKR